MATEILSESNNLAEQLRQSIENQNEIKGSLTELKEIIEREGVYSRQVLERITKVESSSVQFEHRLVKIEATQLEIKLEERRGRWKLIIILVTTILGWIGVTCKQYWGN